VSDRLAMLALERANVARPMARLLLVAIALHARDSATPAYPSLSRLSAITGLDRRTVARLIPELEASGDLTVRRDPGASRHHRANRYLVHPGGPRGKAPLEARDGAPPGLGAELGAPVQERGAPVLKARGTAPPELEGTGRTSRENARANGGEPVRWQDGDEKYLNSPSAQIRAKTREAAERAGIDWRARLARTGALAE
jgi:hypothetical protein